MNIERIIELTLIVGVVVFYFAIPSVAKSIYDVERRRKAVNRLNIVYLLFSLGLIGFVVYDFIFYEMKSDYKLSRIGLVIITIIMYCYTVFLKKKWWFDN